MTTQPSTELLGLPAPAKLNLFLHVTGRREDGYHLLETVFELIDLADTIDLRLRHDGAITLANPIPGVPPETDLTVRAARLLATEAGLAQGVDITLTKRIPMGAGLGGGSSDAATVLLGLNSLWGLNWPRERLARLGVSLGADVPFFVGGHTAFAAGIGEELRPIELPTRQYIVLTPDVHVATFAIFGAPELTRDTISFKIDSLSQLSSVLQAIALGKNDLQPVVVQRFAQVAEAIRVLKLAARLAGAAAEGTRMSGSGSSVFLPVEDGEQARQVLKHLSGLVKLPDQRSSRSDELAGRFWLVQSLRKHPI